MMLTSKRTGESPFLLPLLNYIAENRCDAFGSTSDDPVG